MPLIALSLSASIFSFNLLSPQDIPAGVTYKRAPEAVNQNAVEKLRKFFTASDAKADYVGMSSGALICMPGMWRGISVGCPQELVAAKPASFMVPSPGEVQKFEGRVFKTSHEQLTFWKLLHKRAAGRQPVLRKARSNELKYYWALIPYDIEEPLWIADFGKDRILFDFGGGSIKDPKVLAVEIVGGFK